ncbi:beta-N-acetylhexosaminidase [Blastochloris viridis]|uniref:beta-N-acetylhexosaminidase n=1 Tax=Blastochloris viridis TaxID=1079 RepID=A0A0H5BJU6_BLAVI|nr:beta-N-acetylhexosaminidase [Blastochloris viridis]ALK09330.1 Beta-hexosaminidase [Blastochloris viridis]BAS00792.1 beta N-acetyl-glucosaminidase [Blastochloris viridis]CUU41993.1 Beta-hexosaminidase [Blastochloris viridis]
MSPRAFIAGLAGPRLTAAEQAFFRDAQPWGFILFARNVETPDQVRALTAELRATVGRSDAPVLIDQEGGRVARLKPPHWPEYPPAQAFGRLYAADPQHGRQAARLGARLIAADLDALGITVDCVPCADLALAETHAIIGSRAYGSDPATVAALARAAADGLMAGGVAPIVKHIPGHGRATADSHLELPVVTTPRAELERTDFEAFRRLADLPMAMTAHVVYADIDAEAPATTSKTVVAEVIRGSIGFDGLLMTDDLSMRALQGSFRGRAAAALEAGCDMLLHCNGEMAEMAEIAAVAPHLAGKAAARAATALACARRAEPLDTAAARTAFSAILATLNGEARPG